MSALKWLLVVLAYLLSGPLYVYCTKQVEMTKTWKEAFRGSAKLAPLPKDHRDAIIQVYAARAFNWRGLAADHLWIAAKAANETQYTVYQVVGWYFFHGRPALAIQSDIPDRYWFGNKPVVLKSISGSEAEPIISRIEQAAENYPFKNDYVVWPGPNSNTFIAYVARQVPELDLILPPTALGQDYLGQTKFFAKAPSSTGFQISFMGVFGLTVALKEGIRLNVLGFTTGISFQPLGFIYPGIGIITL